MQRGSFFVKELVLANMSFLSYAQVKVFARKGRNRIQIIVHIFYWKRHISTIHVNSRPCASLHVWYRRSNDRPTRPSMAGFCLASSNAAFSLSISWALVATAVTYTILLKKSRGVKSGLTAQINNERVDSSAWHIVLVYMDIRYFHDI